ncbi:MULTISPECIES: glycosyltransferase [Aeromonas]|uniref:glycosyltransferase n=1 Tax=Aeromonas TaxID=642 RepID=UPI0038D2526A
MVNFSVLLSVYKKEKPKFLLEALKSVFCEQTLKPTQIVLVKDGLLTPELDDEILRWKAELEDKLTVVTLPCNVGLAAALNNGLQHCKYDLVARMDTDDIATPERFKLQVEFMNTHPDISVSSGFIEEWNVDFSAQLSSRLLPLKHDEIVSFAKIRSPISHPACIFRKSVIIEVGGYPDVYPEDHLLWVRVLLAGYKLANIPQVLLRMRTGEDFISRRGYNFLKGELTSYRIMYQSRFITIDQYIKVCVFRTLVRLSPSMLKVWLYKFMR